MKHLSILLTTLAFSLGLFAGPTQLNPESQLYKQSKEIQSIKNANSTDPLNTLTSNPSSLADVSSLSEVVDLSTMTLPQTSTYMETTANSLNFRSGPSVNYSIIGSLPRGTRVELISKYNSSWYKIKANGKIGYTASKYLKAVSQTTPDTDSTLTTTGSVNFRTGPSTSYSIIRNLPSGTKVELISMVSSTWYKVRLSGTIGYVSSKYLTSPPPSSPPSTNSSYYTNASVNFRTGPSTSYSIIRKLSTGTSVILISKYNSTWYKVNVSGTTGYLSSKYLTLSDSSDSSSSIPVHSIGYKGGLHKKITDLRPHLDPAWNGHNYMNGTDLQPFLDKGLLVTWGPALKNYDNKTTMILGHGSGVFNYMINIKKGSLVSISDLNGKVRIYKITDVKSNPNKSIYLTYDNGVSLADIYTHGGKEEAISLQMCQSSVNTHYYGVPID
jgi:uncharacterized protein YgiM (DUF1202 family)